MRKPPSRHSDQLPPHNLDAEQGVLASIIIDGGLLNECIAKNVTAAYFYSSAHQLIYEAMLSLFGNGTHIDEITLCDELRKKNSLEACGGPAYINELTNRIEVTAHAVHWLEIVREKYSLREAVTLGQTMTEQGLQFGSDPDTLLSTFEARIIEIAQKRIPQTVQVARVAMKKTMDQIRFIKENPHRAIGVPTGFQWLNTATKGWRAGQMIVIAARPSMGKTALLCNFIGAALFEPLKQGQPSTRTMLFSLEMNTEEICTRLISDRAGTPIQRVFDGYASKADMESLDRAAQEMGTLPLVIDDAGGSSILEIQAKARREHARNRLGLIAIDYLQLMRGSSPAVPREQQIAEVSRGCKALAKELDVPVIVLSQLNRKSEEENRQPQISDLRESGAIEQDADTIILIGKDDQKKKEEEALINGKIKRSLIIAKQRNGPTGSFPVIFDGTLTRFTPFQG